jgi:cyclic beta-1,2-glucan synthetase
MEMDFRFLLDPEKKLLSIGFSVATNRLDTNCYDLLASEARLASLFAIAKGDVETRHWFRLGRAATPIGAGSALISWSGSMFEYLMPSLVMRAPTGSVLEQTSRLIVARQQAYAAAAGHALGHFGIRLQRPRSGDDLSVFQLRRAGPGAEAGPGENRVIAPYATRWRRWSTPRPRAELCRLPPWGRRGVTGFTRRWISPPSRACPPGPTCAIVRSFMAHHQGMTITAIANALHNGRLRARFHAEPMIRRWNCCCRNACRAMPQCAARATDVHGLAASTARRPVVRRFDSPAMAAADGASAVERKLRRDADPHGGGFQPLARSCRDALARRSDTGGHGSFIFTCAMEVGRGLVSGVQPTGADRGRARCGVLRTSCGLHPSGPASDHH